MRNKIHLNLGKDLLMKLLRHHITLVITYTKNDLLISKGTKMSYTGEILKYLGIGLSAVYTEFSPRLWTIQITYE